MSLAKNKDQSLWNEQEPVALRLLLGVVDFCEDKTEDKWDKGTLPLGSDKPKAETPEGQGL